jgi:type IV secretory pathway TrbL component
MAARTAAERDEGPEDMAGARLPGGSVGRSVGQLGSQSSSSTGRSYAVGKGPVWQQPTPNSFSGKGAVGEANTKCGEGRPWFSN